ncbi:MAG TPA: hypothetical protein VE545_07220 [Candidatus Dormibacteraeota bacterium]|nr:hypothetical protein [Candidatus Dormibacteraeota bacterium]
MRYKHYNPARMLVIVLPCLAGIFFAGAQSAPPQGRRFQETLKTSALESHEGLTISARPWLQAPLYKNKFPKKSPFTAGVLAVQVSFRNDSDQSMKVGLSRIRLTFRVDDENSQELQSLTAEQVADAILRPGKKDPTARRIPLPIPVGGNKSKEFTDLETQAQNAAIPTNVVAAHGTVQGLLYFDLQGQFDLLNTAHLYIPDVSIMGKQDSLLYFEIDLSH